MEEASFVGYTKRLSEGKELCRMFNCPLTKWPPRHRCRGVHCCRDRADCIRQACNAFFAPLRRRIGVPALNRWLSVYPVVCIVLFLNCIHGIFAYAQSVMLGKTPLDGKGDGAAHDADSDAGRQNVDAPRRMDSERRLTKRRQRKTTAWKNTNECNFDMSLWVCIASPMIHLHCYLFRSGSLHGCDRDGYSALFRCCLLERSKPLKELERLGLCLPDGVGGASDLLKLFEMRYGELASLTKDDLSKVETAVQLEIGGLFRRFLVRFRCYSWRLAYFIAGGVSPEDRMRACVKFSSLPLCCLDEMSSRRLR